MTYQVLEYLYSYLYLVVYRYRESKILPVVKHADARELHYRYYKLYQVLVLGVIEYT